MHCKKCGASIEATDIHCSQCGAKLKASWKKPPALIRLVMQIISLLMCLTLIFSLIATVLVADINALTSSGGIEKIISALIINDSQEMPDPTIDPSAYAIPAYTLSNTTGTTGSAEPSEGQQIPDNIEVSVDVLTDPDALAEFVGSFIEGTLGEDVTLDPEQLSNFIEESTVMEFFAEKIASYVDDMLSGERTTTITVEELMQLLDENQALLEETFQIELTEEHKETINEQASDMLIEFDLNNSIREGIDEFVNTPIEGMDDTTIGDLLAIVQKISKPSTIMLAAGFCLLLMLAMCLLNYYNIPQALRWCGFPCLISGGLLSAPLIVLKSSPDILSELMPDTAALLNVVNSALSVVAPLHYGILILGVVLIVFSFLWRLIFKP